MLHAHEKMGKAVDQDSELAVHVITCHRHDDCDHCQHWHLHFVLWGEVQPDSHSGPQRPQPKDLQSEFAIAPSHVTLAAELASLEVPSWKTDAVVSCCVLFSATLGDEAVDRALISSYQCRVAASHDVALLLMVARC